MLVPPGLGFALGLAGEDESEHAHNRVVAMPANVIRSIVFPSLLLFPASSLKLGVIDNPLVCEKCSHRRREVRSLHCVIIAAGRDAL